MAVKLLVPGAATGAKPFVGIKDVHMWFLPVVKV
jgi:hypothetical protein